MLLATDTVCLSRKFVQLLLLLCYCNDCNVQSCVCCIEKSRYVWTCILHHPSSRASRFKPLFLECHVCLDHGLDCVTDFFTQRRALSDFALACCCCWKPIILIFKFHDYTSGIAKQANTLTSWCLPRSYQRLESNGYESHCCLPHDRWQIPYDYHKDTFYPFHHPLNSFTLGLCI